MCTPAPPPVAAAPPPPPPPTPSPVSLDQSRGSVGGSGAPGQKEAGLGSRSSVLTSGLGLRTQASAAKKTLLGQ